MDKKLRDLTDLYEDEKSRADNAENTLRDFWRREPTVHLLWSEVVLLRRILEVQYKLNPSILSLPQERADSSKKINPLTHRDRLISATLQTLNTNSISVDDYLQNVAKGVYEQPGLSQSPTKILEQQFQQREQPLSASSDIVSSEIQAQQTRIIQLEQQYAALQQQHALELAALRSTSAIPPAPASDSIIPSPPQDGSIPPPPQDGSVPPAPDNAPSPAAAAPASAIPQAPVLPGFIGSGGAAAPTGTATTTVDGKPVPPVLPGFTPHYPGQSGASAGPAVVAKAAAPPVDPGPQPTKAMVKPGKKMKALHWKPIITGEKSKQNELAKTSIWAEIDRVYATAQREVDVMDFENRFTSAAPKPKAGGDDAVKQTPSDKPQRLLDPNRHNQLSIMLSKMPAIPEMKKALIELDMRVLKPEMIESLHKNMFTAEDVELVRGSGLSKDKLLLPEQWILEMSKLPQLAARIECWKFQLIFEEEYNAVMRPLTRMEACCNEIRSSQMLRKFFTYILVIGNYLNGSTPRGRADGFNIESLGKLFRIKDAEGTGTLVDYIVQFMSNKFGPDCITTLRNELTTLTETKNTSLRQIAGDAKKLLGKINLTNKMQTLVVAQNIPGDHFEAILTPFSAQAEQKVKALDSRAQAALAAFTTLVGYLEPDLEKGAIDKIQSEEWLPLIEEFVSGVVTSQKMAIKKAEDEAKAAKSAAGMASLKAAMANKGGGANNASQDAATNELSNGFPKLRPANATQQNPSTSATSPQGELAGGFPKLRSANSVQPPNNGAPLNELSTGGFPQLRSTGGPNNASNQRKEESQQGFIRPQLKPTQTKQEMKVENVAASEFDNVKRVSAKSNVFLKAQNKQLGGQTVQIQAEQLRNLPPPPEEDEEPPSFVPPNFTDNLDLPPPPPSDSD